MAEVDLPEQRVRFPHSLQDRDCTDPETDGHNEAPPRSEAERQAHRRQHSYEDQFAIGAEDLVRAVCGLVDRYLSREIRRRHIKPPQR
jgi:hypothetical protein